MISAECQTDSIRTVLSRGYVELEDGSTRKIADGVTLDEAHQLSDLVQSRDCQVTAETGVACGVSTLAICMGLERSGRPDFRHFGIDPNQLTTYGGAAVQLLRQHGLERHFELLNGPTHLEAPKLLERHVSLDFAFIDGWHTFDYTLLDFFYMDKLLKAGGVLGFHDSYGPAKRKVASFLLTHRRYRRLPVRRTPFRPWIKSLAAGLLYSDASAIYRLDRLPALCFYEKLESWEPNYDFYARF